MERAEITQLCERNDIPYLGFFDPVFSPERPFEL